jgi:hypothetical protein
MLIVDRRRCHHLILRPILLQRRLRQGKNHSVSCQMWQIGTKGGGVVWRARTEGSAESRSSVHSGIVSVHLQPTQTLFLTPSPTTV